MKENIEEDIIALEQYLIAIDTFGTIDYKCINNLYEPVKSILSDYKRVLKENEKLKKQNYDLLRKLKNRVKEVRKLEKYSMYKKEFSTLNKKVNELQKENEELKHKYDKALSDLVNAEKKNEELKRLIAHRNGYTQQLEKDLFENCSNYVISKQKVKDKIEELKERPLTINENNKYYYETDAYNKIIIQVLQDLLEEKGE